jgi:hypothetical protein
MLHPDELRATVLQASQRLYLRGKGLEQPRHRRGLHGSVSIAAGGTPEPCQHGHCDCVGARHLNSQCCFDLVFWLSSFDECQHGVDAGL